ncbi:hypothetical protein NNJEOMEG_00317 [Fundidesulfovibrio magnetotacticus]|uniref:AB hydrolase-1 domain-containing protein n=1 Tax=Fundidesulfovibrio magnetotacticus TaxID=2730080 RepID=A0A6V8LIC5_9BACT|nr:alpha/beta hydrolase [Fundidesulfovibrio magnetotacticus]GFK92492.1 hypothetical protein NNJEOMEG_00317 [Fundidesulfovibrio magnetotacticus]
MSAPARLLFLHGWGLDASFWKPLLSRFPGHHAAALDLGYFGPERPDPPREFLAAPGPLVAVGHSLGFAALLRREAPRPDALACLGGFARFPGPPGAVRAMRRGLARDPRAVLAAFHEACALPAHLRPDTSRADSARLAKGLDHLLQWDESPRLEAWSGPLLALGAEDDTIVPRQAFLERFPGAALLPGGHAFPATRPDETFRLLQAFLERP